MDPRGIAPFRTPTCDWSVRTYLLLLMGLTCLNLEGQVGQGNEEVRQRADAAYESGSYLEAMADYERLVSLYPEEACLHGRLAGCALKEPGRLALVRRHLRIAIRKGCSDPDLGFHQARLAQLEYDFERARDLYAAYLVSGGKKARFKMEAERGAIECADVGWSPDEAVSLEVHERIPADPAAAFRYYNPDVEGLRLIATPNDLRSKADLRAEQGSMALHDGDTILVFSSLGKKGSAGWDLWKVSVRAGTFSEPVSLGEGVNSVFDEKDAYLSKEGMLYFSSNRPGGLGGFDIYAVTCGQDGMPTGVPYRLPYPINSVNDDVFFIPESDGGAWMASDRASVEGKVHAYRIGIGDGVMATGSVAWSADEVEDAGLSLRVFSGGEEVAVDDLDREGTHLNFHGGESVRIVLEDATGALVSEAFGAGEGAWELKQGLNGWEVVAKSDVAADWAVLSDLQVGSSGEELIVDGGISDEMGGEVPEESGWAEWLSDRMDGPDDAMADAGDPRFDARDVPPTVSEDIGSEVSADHPEANGGDDEADGTGALELEEGVDGNEAGLSSGVEAAAEEQPEKNAAWPEEWDVEDVGALAEEIPASFEVVDALLEQYPDVVVGVWEERANQVLELERGFLDAPDFRKAGELYDALEQMESWSPDQGMIDERLRDGVALEDIRDMLDEWSRAVQSATKASLARVAGEAALAYRRDRLAARELRTEADLDVTALKLQWSNWRNVQRGVEIEDGGGVEMGAEDGAILFRDWTAVLEASEAAWSKKERSGWRGAWLKRELDFLERSRDIWDAFILEAEVADESAPTGPSMDETPEQSEDDPVEDVQDSPEGESASAGEDSNAVDEDTIDDVGILPEASVEPESTEFINVLFAGASRNVQAAVEDGESVVEGSISSDVEREWMDAVGSSRQVARAWDRLGERLDGSGMAIVRTGKEWMLLDEAVRLAHQELLESTLGVLDVRLDEAARDRRESLRQWDEEAAFLPERLVKLLGVARDAEAELERLEEAMRTVEGEGLFELLMERKEAALTAAVAWREWELGFASEVEALSMNVEATPVEEPVNPMDGPSVMDADVMDAEVRDEQIRAAIEEVQAGEGEPEGSSTEDVVAEAPVQAAPDQAGSVEGKLEMSPSLVIPASRGMEAGLGELLPGRSSEELERFAAVLQDMELRAESEDRIWNAGEAEVLAAWQERRQIEADRPSPSSGRPARMAWDKRRFFNERRLRNALQSLDLDLVERRLAGEDMVVVEPEPGPGLDGVPNGMRDVVDEVEDAPDTGTPRAVDADSEMLERQDEDAAAFGLVLPSAEVVGRSSGTNGRRGLTLRPIERETIERAILNNPESPRAGSAADAASRFEGDRGAPVTEGVEYKVQVGAFLNALPAALFAAFDPMWAQRLSNGITRYMAGSFDAYDRAVDARDAIRGLGYEDAFVVRFVDGERVSGARPAAEDLAVERVRSNADRLPEDGGSASIGTGTGASSSRGVTEVAIPTRREDIPTWEGVSGRVYSVQVGAFRGVPDPAALVALGTLTREDAGPDGWLRLFSGRFDSEAEAVSHRDELKRNGRQDAFIVVYINGRRIPLSQASTTSVAPLPTTEGEAVNRVREAEVAQPLPIEAEGSWYVELGVFTSTIPVRLANAILDAPLEWEIRSVRENGRTLYRTRGAAEDLARNWRDAARSAGFANARLARE